MKKIISLMILFGLMISMLSSCNKESTKPYGKNTDPSNTNMFLIYEMDGDKYKYGYISFDGKFVIPPQYDSVSRFQKEFGSLAAVRIKDKEGKIKKAGFINTLGKMVYKFEDVLSLFSYDLAGVKKDGKWGFIDSTGKFVIEPKFDSIDSFNRIYNLARVEINGKYGYINREGEVVIDIVWTTAKMATDKYKQVVLGFCVSDGENSKWLNTDGGLICETAYDDIAPFTEKYIIVKENDKYGIIDVNGNLIHETVYDYLEPISDRYVLAQKGGKHGMIDTDGNVIVNIIYSDFSNNSVDECIEFSLAADNMFNREICLVDFNEEAKVSYPQVYTSHYRFCDIGEDDVLLGSDVVMAFRTNVYNRRGELLFNKRDDVYYVNSCAAHDMAGNCSGIIILDPQTKKYGVMNSDGQIVVKTVYDSLNPTNSNICRIVAVKNGVLGIIDENYEFFTTDYMSNIEEPNINSFGYWYRLLNGKVDIVKCARIRGKDNLTHYVDLEGRKLEGEVISAVEYDDGDNWPSLATDFYYDDNGYAIIDLGDHTEAIINRDGEIVLTASRRWTKGIERIKNEEKTYYTINEKKDYEGKETFMMLNNDLEAVAQHIGFEIWPFDGIPWD